MAIKREKEDILGTSFTIDCISIDKENPEPDDMRIILTESLNASTPRSRLQNWKEQAECLKNNLNDKRSKSLSKDEKKALLEFTKEAFSILSQASYMLDPFGRLGSKQRMAEFNGLLKNASELIMDSQNQIIRIRDANRQQGCGEGGRCAGETRNSENEDRNNRIIRRAKEYIKDGKSMGFAKSNLSDTYSLTIRQIGNILKEAGVTKPRKKTEMK